MNPPVSDSNGFLFRMVQAADDARKQYKFSEAIQALERASRLDPSRSDIWLKLAGLYAETFEVAAAERCFEQAVRMARNKAGTLAVAGRICSDVRHAGLAKLAEGFYLRALNQPKPSPLLYVQLADIYELLRRGDEAGAMLDQALQRDRNCPEALLARARLERLAGHLEAAEKTIRSVVSKPNPDIGVHARTWYELGAILDRQEKYDEAFNAFVQAKAILQPLAAPFHSKQMTFHREIKALQTGLKPETLQRWLTAAPALAPARRIALLGGHPRSGTTLLEQVLDAHPDIISAEETEIFQVHSCSTLCRRFPGTATFLSVLVLTTRS